MYICNMDKNDWRDLMEYEILSYLHKNKNTEFTIDDLCGDLLHHDPTLIRVILGEMKVYVGIGKYKITEIGIRRFIYLKDEKRKPAQWFWKGAIVSFIAALIAGAPTIIQTIQRPHQDKYIVIQKSKMSCDTIYVLDNLIKN